LQSTDPDGILSHTIPRKNLLGSQCFISGAAKPDYSLWETHWPSERNTLLFGELDGGGATRAQQLADLFQGSRVQVQTNVCQPDDPQHIRDHIFDKLLINCSINTIGALTKLDCGETCETNSPSNRLLQRLVTEAIAVGEHCVPPLTLTHTPQSISKHYNNQYGLKSSMLHDVENHRQLEKGFIVDPLVELGKVYNVPTPCLETVSDLLDVYEHQRVRG
jgi:ketopantoate reductase